MLCVYIFTIRNRYDTTALEIRGQNLHPSATMKNRGRLTLLSARGVIQSQTCKEEKKKKKIDK